MLRRQDLPRLQESKTSWLDRPLLTGLTLDWEKGLYALFIGLAVLTRLWDLGTRVMSHDETVHIQWSWYLFKGSGYVHDPLSHGPFLYHANVLFYFLFGDNDVSARLAPALLGVVLVAIPYAFRRWLGRTGALVASFLFLISPSLLYYSRYARNDVPLILWVLIALWAVFHYLEGGTLDQRARWLIALAGALALMFATKEMAFIYIAILGLFLIILFSTRLESPGGTLLTLAGFFGVILVAMVLVLLCLSLFELFPVQHRDCEQVQVLEGGVCVQADCRPVGDRCQRPIPVLGENVQEYDQAGVRVAIRLTAFEVIGALFLELIIALAAGAAIYWMLDRWMPFKRGERAEVDLILFIGSFVLPFLGALAVNFLPRILSRVLLGVNAPFDPLDYSEAGLTRTAGFVFVLLAASGAAGIWWNWRRWLPAAALFYTIFVLLFTTLLTNGKGWASGLVGSLGYWIKQQDVQRGDQPFYYFFVLVPLYEYLPIIGFLAAAGYAALRKTSKGIVHALLYVPIDSIVWFGLSWLVYVVPIVSKEALPWYKLPAAMLENLPPWYVVPISFIAAWVSLGIRRAQNTFVSFLLFWSPLTWLVYAVAGEKMPWYTPHFAVPMTLATAWVVGKLVESTDWRAIWRQRGWLVWVAALVGLMALVQTLSILLRPEEVSRLFAGRSLNQLDTSAQFLIALLIFLLSLGGLYWIWEQIGTGALGRMLTGLALVILVGLTVRTAWLFAYVNHDYAREFMVYAHGAPGVRDVMQQVEDISRRTTGGLNLDIVHDGQYPILWYLRNYPNAVSMPKPPSRQSLDKSVVIVSDGNWPSVEPYLGDAYVCNRYIDMWWPMQAYYGLNWQRIIYAITNPAMRSAVWDIIWGRDYERYERTTGEMVTFHARYFRFCVQRDLMAEVWSERIGPAGIEFVEPEPRPPLPDYAAMERSVTADLVIADLGEYGRFSGPHDMAIDADGFIYVVDSYNHRIVKLSPEGQVADVWGSTWHLGLQPGDWLPGCVTPEGESLALSDGEFCEPWGITVGPEGRVYVADTWNHRLQVFSSDGQFLSKVGQFIQANDPKSDPAQFYGPRDVVVGADALIYVSDTGNKRIQVFDQDLRHRFTFGGPGIIRGRLEEPVGLALSPDELIYVADTWNFRIQAFTLVGTVEFEWFIDGWQSQSTVNKPYMALDSTGHVYASDPEGSRVLVFDAQGELLAVLVGQSADGVFLQWPTGVVLDDQDNLWVSDGATGRLLRFPPLGLQPEAQPSDQ